MDAHTSDKQPRLTGEEESETERRQQRPRGSSTATALLQRPGEDFQDQEQRGEAGDHDKQRRPGPSSSSSSSADLYSRSARRFAPSLSARLHSSRSTTTAMEAWRVVSQSSPTEDTDPESDLLARAIRNASASVAPQPQPQPHLGWNPMGASPVQQGHAGQVVEAYGDDHSEDDKATASELACDKQAESSGAATAAASSAQFGSWHPTEGDGPSQLAPDLAMGGQDAIVPYDFAIHLPWAPPTPAADFTWAPPMPIPYFPVHYWAPIPPYYADPNWAPFPYATVPNGASSSSTHGNGGAAHPGTKLCKYWAKAGGCRHGAMCRFAHGHVELRGYDDNTRYNTNDMCRYVLNGITCQAGQNCPFRHR